MHDNIRAYTPADEPAWLRCRVLSFLPTAYFDDVCRAKPEVSSPGAELVAVGSNGAVIGIMDVSVEGDLATIDTVAVHPDHQRRGIGRSLLERAVGASRQAGATTLDAWTRDDPDTLRWYRAMGFDESGHYLHVYANYYTDLDEPVRAIGTPRPGLRPIMMFLHGNLAEEAQMRAEFARVHVCRRFSMAV